MENIIVTDQECDAATEYAKGRRISRFVRDGDAIVLVLEDSSRLRFTAPGARNDYVGAGPVLNVAVEDPSYR